MADTVTSNHPAAAERRPNGRLSCQLVVKPQMEGLIVHLPETQA